MQSKKLSVGAINTISQFNFRNKEEHTIDYVFQVIAFKTSPTKQKGFCVSTVSLSDSKHKRSGFLFFHEDENVDIVPHDLVRIRRITPTIITKNEVDNYFFIVKSFELECKCEELFGTPVDYSSSESNETNIDTTTGNTNSSNTINTSNIIQKNEPTTTTNTSNTNNIKTNFSINVPSRNVNLNTNSKNAPLSLPLSGLSSFSKDFTVVVKITVKNPMKTYTNQKGEGCLFGFTMIDSEGTEMECTAFNVAAKKVYDILQKDKVYSIKGAYIKINDKKFASVKNDYKMILEDNVQITEITNDNTIDESNFKFAFTKISEIESYTTNEAIEVIGKVVEVGDSREVNTKNGMINLKKIKIVDSSNTAIEISLWRQHADQDFTKGEIIIFKNIKINNYGGTKTLNTIENTTIIRDLNIPERTELELFFSNKADSSYKSLGKQSGEGRGLGEISFLSDVLQALDDNVNEGQDKMPIFKVKATISSFVNSEKNFYLGCSNCHKKIIEDTMSSKLQCQACNTFQDKPNYIYTVSIRIKDSTSEENVDIYGNLTEKLTKMSCQDYRDLWVAQDETKLKQLKHEIEYKQYYFLVKPKLQVFNNIPRKKIATLKIEPVDSSFESNRLVEALNHSLTL